MSETSLPIGGENIPKFKQKILKNCIVDRGSKYTVVIFFVSSNDEVKNSIKLLQKDKYFMKATHNSYAFRILGENGIVLESKNDDGETGAGNCILIELQRENFVNILIVVTRYFGGIKLESDRFKNVINATKMGIEEVR